MTKKALDHLVSAWKSARQALLAVATVLAYGMVIVGSVYAQTSPPQPQAIDELVIARAVELFLANRQYEALQALAPETLERSGKANLLAGLIYLNRPHENPDKARPYFERAGRLGVSHAYAALGNLILGDDCADCPVRAAKLLSQALADHDDPDARLGLALAWIELGKKQSAQAEFDRLLEDPTPLYIRVLAASFAGAFRVESDPKRAEELLLFAASQGSAGAQEILGLWYLREGRKSEAESWLARAVGQRAELAMKWYRAQSRSMQIEIVQQSINELVQMSGTGQNTYFAKAARWCRRSGAIDLLCLPDAAEHHDACSLTQETLDLLGIKDFESSPAYNSCRLRERYGNPLPEKPQTWPLLRD
jgi:TPR repeat protein